jgi:predicted aldo/keto reductase-like oxidoreductase
VNGDDVVCNHPAQQAARLSYRKGELLMDYRTLGRSGLKVPVLSFGTATFGGGNDFFRKWGSTNAMEARRLVDLCLESGVNLFDTANVLMTSAARAHTSRNLAKTR